MTPRVDPTGTTQFCPICEHNAGNVESEFRMNGPFAAKIARLLSALKMKMEYESEERKSATQIVLIDRICWDALKEWQPKKRGEV